MTPWKFYTLLLLLTVSIHATFGQTDSTNLVIESWVNSAIVEVEFPRNALGIKRRYEELLRLKFNELGDGKFTAPLTDVLLFSRVVRDEIMRVNFVINPARYPLRYNTSFQENMVGFLMICKIGGQSLFDKIITTASFIANENPDGASVDIMMNPPTVYTFNWNNLYPKYPSLTRSVDDMYPASADYFAIIGEKRVAFMNIGGGLIEGTVRYSGRDINNSRPKAMLDTIRNRLIRRLSKEYPNFKVAEKNDNQIEMYEVKNVITYNDKCWELIEISLCSFNYEQEILSYNILVGCGYYDAGWKYPDKDFMRRKGKSFDPTYTPAANSFVKKAMNLLNN